MDRIEGVPEGYQLGSDLHIDYKGSTPLRITFELVPVEQPKQLEASDAELIDFLSKQYTTDEDGDAVWHFCFSKDHTDFRAALKSWMQVNDRVTIREKGAK